MKYGGTVRPETNDFALDVRQGLTAMPKRLPPKHFYDELGSALFAAICALPEYYVWRAEKEIFDTHATEIVRAFGSPLRLIELGAGNATKTRILLDAAASIQPSFEYVAVDIDPASLASTVHDLGRTYPAARVISVASDFQDIQRTLAVHMPPDSGVRNVVLFLGSTIGNLTQAEADPLLSGARRLLGVGDAILLGTDLTKPKKILEDAYDDPTGVTAAFNLNLLGRINRELGADFDLRAFRHRAFYDETEQRIEMHLVSNTAQEVRIDTLDLNVAFESGETIHTESSYKFDEESIAALAVRNGFRAERRWTDSRGWFADTLLVAA
jgi:dimethylhistidine N-methyltransferase